MSLLVHRNIVKVEQVATRIVAAAIPNAGVALHWSIRSRQRSGPCRAAIVGVRDPTVPGPFEVNVLVIAFGGGAEEDDCGPVRISGHRGWESSIVDSPATPNIE